MNLRTSFSAIVASLIALIACSPLPAQTLQNTVNSSASHRQTLGDSPKGDLKKLLGKWIVRFVERNGSPNAGQIGQQVGDVITIKRDGERFALG